MFYNLPYLKKQSRNASCYKNQDFHALFIYDKITAFAFILLNYILN